MCKALNLYAGLGGNRKLWKGCKVTSVENDPRIAAVYARLYPDDEVIVGDAHEYLAQHFTEYDFIWSSPPCQSHSRMMKATRHKVAKYPDMRLYEEILLLRHFFKGKWVVENVKPYYEPLIAPTKSIGRHLFWSNFEFDADEVPAPKGFIQKSSLEGKQQMMDWLGIHYPESIYYGTNHCPVQILRNCVHPNLGQQIFQAVNFPNL
jgi:DNA (cytosine-5)-methyltransferase 1